uniref:Signal recognition particle subunit SRP68 n=1 Tax=Hirondellea gigas TaxID=1518452 RepID=A0A6A7G753_9CRUS
MEIDEANEFKVTLPILAVIKTSQQQNGLRHNDYRRYRQYCTRRLRRVRKTLKFTHGRKNFVKRTVELKDIKDERYLLIPLMQAERAWAYAMQQKHEMTDDRDRSRFHLIRRLTKAAFWSSQLTKLCSVAADARTALEAEAYCSWMNGNILLEREIWSDALEKFVHAKTVFDQLSKLGNLEQNALCHERSENLGPSIKYCSYVLGSSAGGDGSLNSELLKDRGTLDEILLSKVENVMSDIRTQQAKSFDTIQWKGEYVPIHNEKVRLSILRSNELTSQLDGQENAEKQMDLFIEVFSSYDEALVFVRNDLQNEANKRVRGSEPGPREVALGLLRDYLTFHKLRNTIHRNLLLTESLTASLDSENNSDQPPSIGKKSVKPSDLVVMYEKLLNNVENLGEVGEMKSNESLHQEVRLKTAVFTSFRCFYVAESYAAALKWAEAYALYQRCVEHCLAAIQLFRSLEINSTEIVSLEKLSSNASARRVFVHAHGLLALEDQENSITSNVSKLAIDDRKDSHLKLFDPKPTLLQRLNTFDSGSPQEHYNLIHFPPRFEAIPCKPILFDLAFNYVEFRDLSHRAKPVKKSGLFSFLTGK